MALNLPHIFVVESLSYVPSKISMINIYKSKMCEKQPFSSLYKLFSMLTECTAENNEHEHGFTFQ